LLQSGALGLTQQGFGSVRPPSGKALQHMSAESSAARLRLDARSSTPRGARTPLCSTPGKDLAIVDAVRKKIESLDEKFSGQIARVQQQNDRLRDLAISRVDSKLGSMEAQHPKISKTLSELTGNYKGLSDEVQSMIRRLDQMDGRFWEFRHELEEEVRGKLADVESRQQHSISSLRVAHDKNDDLLKRYSNRLLRLEGLMEGILTTDEETQQNVVALHERLSELEEFRGVEQMMKLPSKAPVLEDTSTVSDRALVSSMMTRHQDLNEKVERLQEEIQSHHSHKEAQEQRLRSLRTQMDAKEDHYRWLTERVERADWDIKLKELRSHMQELREEREEHVSTIDAIQKRHESHEEAIDGVQQAVHRLHEHVASTLQTCKADNGANYDIEMCDARLADVEGRIAEISAQVESLLANAEFAPRVSELVEQLKKVAPKVINQEQTMRELHEKVGRLDMQETFAKTAEASANARQVRPDGPSMETLSARVKRLEEEVARIVADSESSDLGKQHSSKIVEAAPSDPDAE